MKTKIGSFLKRGIAVGMMAVLAFMLPATPLHESQVQAATVKSTCEYLKDVKLYIKKGGSVDDAKSWCTSQEGDWKVFEGNLNAGASAMMTKEVGVFLCYTTTQDPEEAITDLAVMNEKGGYSVSDYEMILKTKKETYIDIVNNMKTMLEEYRKNYENKTEIAVMVHDHLNKYKEDDSDQLLGDLLLTVEDDKLAEILLQCNGKIYLDIQQQLSMSCDTAKTTWLDRMVKLGGYDKLKSAFSKNASSGNATKSLDKQFRDKANKILDGWDDMSERVKGINTFVADNGLENATEEEFNQWVKNLEATDEAFYSYQEVYLLSALAGYKYGNKTLLDFFSKTKAQIEKEGVEVLYPMAACLTDGQIAALDSDLSIYKLVQDAFVATVVNDNNVGMAADLKKDATETKKAEEIIENAKEFISEAAGVDVVSIYEGVDRDVYNGGVAVTSDAKRASNASKKPWLSGKSIMSSENELLVSDAIVLGVGLIAGVCAYRTHTEYIRLVNASIRRLSGENGTYFLKNYIDDAQRLIKAAKDGKENAMCAMEMINNEIYQDGSSLMTWLGLGRIITSGIFLIIAAFSIYFTVDAIINFYNIDHIEIPHHMVDLSYSETKEESYVTYKTVPDQDGKPGDLNGNSSLQWLGLYYTRDENAGTPILAPTEEGHEMALQTGTTDAPGAGYSPLHMFGTKNVAQNLTYADGNTGYSFADDNGGTFLYYTHANAVVTYSGGADDNAGLSDGTDPSDSAGDAASGGGADLSGDANQTATTITGGLLALVGAACLMIGGFAGFVIANRRKRKLPIK